MLNSKAFPPNNNCFSINQDNFRLHLTKHSPPNLTASTKTLYDEAKCTRNEPNNANMP